MPDVTMRFFIDEERELEEKLEEKYRELFWR